MNPKAKQEKVNREAEEKEKDAIKTKIKNLISKVPEGVLKGSYQTAVNWKESALKAKQVAESKAPTLKKLRDAYAQLSSFYSVV